MYNDPFDTIGYGVGTGFAAFIGTIIVMALLPAVIGYVLWSIFAMYLFDKAGVEGKWRAWVPVYSQMVFYKLGDVNPWLILIIGIPSALLTFIWIGTLGFMALAMLTIMVAIRISQRAKGEAAWVAIPGGVPGIGVIIWLGIMAFSKERWNSALPPAAWSNTFLADKTQWQGVPSPGSGPTAGPGYPPPAPPQPPYGGPVPPAPPAPPQP